MPYLKEVDLQIEVKKVYTSLDLDNSINLGINYQLSDLTNPTAVKVPYSAQISIPKTKRNVQIFANIGIDSTAKIIDPISLINFRLYINESIFQIGYISIEEVDIEENGNYKIRLYGSLGDYFYKLTEWKLSELPIDCDHYINKDSLWETFDNDTLPYGYALTYQGEYEKFDNDKVDTGSEITEATWTGGSGTFINVDLDEHKRNSTNISGEYRSYYQKPTLRLKSITEAIVEKSIEEGYDVTLDDAFFSEDNPYYNDIWLLCNNYEVGNIPGGYGYTISEFGDDGTKRTESVLKIQENNAVDIYNEEIPASRFISTTDSSSISPVVAISEIITLQPGETLIAKLFTKMIATFYDDSKDDQRYRYKNTDLNVNLNIVDMATGQVVNDVTTTNAAADSLVGGRKFNSNNVGKKRPSNRDNKYFGEQNFAYDKPVDRVEYVCDCDTKWAYHQTYTATSEINVRIVLAISGNTWWRANKNPTRKYGVAFKILDGSSIQIRGKVSENDDRKGAYKTYEQIIGNEYSCFDLLLSYCKLFGLFFKVDDATHAISILLKDNYYTGEFIDWTAKIDRSKEFSLVPLALSFQKGVFKYNDLDTKYEELYKAGTSVSYGSFTTHTGYELDNSEHNYLDGTIFDNCIIATDYSKYFSGRKPEAFKDNKELPHLQTSDGSKVELNGYILLFREREPYKLDKKIALSDDTDTMSAYGTICWTDDKNHIDFIDSIPHYVRTIRKDENNYYSLNFGKPSISYSDSEKDPRDNAGIYSRYWRSYLNDRLDGNCKLLTCYVFIQPSDLQNDLLAKFIYINHTIWVIDQIYNFNPLSSEPTKVRLVKVKDINNYLDHANLSETFSVSYNGQVLYDNTVGSAPESIVLDNIISSITLDIESTTSWNASSSVSFSPTSGDEGSVPMTVTIPISVNSSSITYTYGNNNKVSIPIIRQTLVQVTARTENGLTTLINGLSSPQQIAIGSTATFSATGTTEFLYWMINGQTYTNQVTTLTVTGPTTAIAYFMASGQIKLYCDDPYTIVNGVTKTNNYWILTIDQSYAFSNNQSEFSGFRFGEDKQFSGQGYRKILNSDNYVTVYYNQLLLNLSITNHSKDHAFDSSHLFLGDPEKSTDELYELDFDEIPPTATHLACMSGEAGDKIICERYEYHYPVISPSSLPETKLTNVTIDAYPVGWEGDQHIVLEEGGAETLTRTVYGPVSYTLTTEGGVSVEPTSGSSDMEVEIEIDFSGGTKYIYQNIGEFVYTLTIVQPSIKAIGWLGDGTVILNVNVERDVTEYETIFYNNGATIVVDEELTTGEQQIDEDNSQYYEVTATFEPNIEIYPITRTFTIQCNGNPYTLNITQGAGEIPEGTYWGQTPDENNTVTGALTGADGLTPSVSCNFDIGSEALKYNNGYFCDTVKADTFKGKMSGKLIVELSATQQSVYDGSENITIHIPKLDNWETYTVSGQYTRSSDQSGYGNITVRWYLTVRINKTLRVFTATFRVPSDFAYLDYSTAYNITNTTTSTNTWDHIKSQVNDISLYTPFSPGTPDYASHNRNINILFDSDGIWLHGRSLTDFTGAGTSNRYYTWSGYVEPQ